MKIIENELARAIAEKPFFSRYRRYKSYSDTDIANLVDVVSQTQENMQVRCFGYTSEAAYSAFLTLRNALEVMTDQSRWSLNRHHVAKWTDEVTCHATSLFARALRRWLHHSELVCLTTPAPSLIQIRWPHQQLHKRYQDLFLRKNTVPRFAGVMQIQYDQPKYTYLCTATTDVQMKYALDAIYHIYTQQYHRPRPA